MEEPLTDVKEPAIERDSVLVQVWPLGGMNRGLTSPPMTEVEFPAELRSVKIPLLYDITVSQFLIF
jgi:hypothetical protein